MSECVFKEGGVVKDGNISLSDVKAKIKPTLSEQPELEKVVFAALDVCVPLAQEKSDENKKKISEAPLNIKDIDPMYGYVLHCSAAKIFADCPQSLEFESKNIFIFTSNRSNRFQNEIKYI